MDTTVQYPEVEPAICIPADVRLAASTFESEEYRNAVACLYAISELSPRVAHQMMRKIVGVYRDLAAIAEIEVE